MASIFRPGGTSPIYFQKACFLPIGSTLGFECHAKVILDHFISIFESINALVFDASVMIRWRLGSVYNTGPVSSVFFGSMTATDFISLRPATITDTTKANHGQNNQSNDKWNLPIHGC